MKVIGIVGSPRKNGNTERLITEALSVLESQGLEVEMVKLGGLEIKPCDGCLACRQLKDCKIRDDFQQVYAKMVAADGIIIGSPVYFAGPTPQVLSLLHRAGYLSMAQGRVFDRKVGGPIVVARRAGETTAFTQLLMFFLHQGMIVPGSTYWNVAFGRAPGEVENDKEGMETVRNFAANVAWTLGKLAKD